MSKLYLPNQKSIIRIAFVSMSPAYGDDAFPLEGVNDKPRFEHKTSTHRMRSKMPCTLSWYSSGRSCWSFSRMFVNDWLMVRKVAPLKSRFSFLPLRNSYKQLYNCHFSVITNPIWVEKSYTCKTQSEEGNWDFFLIGLGGDTRWKAIDISVSYRASIWKVSIPNGLNKCWVFEWPFRLRYPFLIQLDWPSVK